MNRIYRVIWNCTLQVFQACSELTRRAGKTSTVNLRKSSGLTTKFSRLTLGVLLALSGSASGASLEVDNDQITNIDTDVALAFGLITLAASVHKRSTVLNSLRLAVILQVTSR